MKRFTKKDVVVTLIGIFFMFLFGHIFPTWAAVTRMGVQYLGIMIGWIVMCAFGLPMSIASIMAMAACTLPGYFTASAAISSSLGNSITVLVIFIFVLVYVFEQSGTGEFLVRWFLSRKIVNGRPYLFTAFFLLAIIVIGSVIGSFGAISLTIAILNNIAGVSGMKKQDPYIRFLLLSVVALSGVTEILYPFKPYAQLYSGIFNASLESVGTQISGTTYLQTSVTIAAVSFVLLMLLARFIFRFDLTKIRELDISTLRAGEFQRMRPDQMIILAVTMLSFFHPFIVMLLPEGSAVYNFLNNMGQALFMGLLLCLLALIKIGGKPVMDPATAFAKGVNWHVVFAIGSVLLVGTALASDECGIAAWLLEIFTNTLGGMGIIPVMIAVALLSCIITQFFSNSATAIIFCTVLAPISAALYQEGVNISVFPAIIGIGTLTACILPSGSGQSAIMLGTEIFQGSDGQKWAFSKGLLILATVTLAVVLSGVACISIL